MPEVVKDAPNYTIEWDSDIDAILHKWTGFTAGDQFREGANDLLEVIESKNTSKLLVDTSNIKAHNDGDKQWLQEEWVPKMLEAGIEHSAQVHSDSAISKMEMEGLMDAMDDIPYDAYITSSLEEGREWLAEQ